MSNYLYIFSPHKALDIYVNERIEITESGNILTAINTKIVALLPSQKISSKMQMFINRRLLYQKDEASKQEFISNAADNRKFGTTIYGYFNRYFKIYEYLFT